MTKNMGNVDRTIRVVIAIAIGALYFTGVISGTVALVLGFFAAIFVLTSFVGSCPLYIPLGLSTRKETPGSRGA